MRIVNLFPAPRSRAGRPGAGGLPALAAAALCAGALAAAPPASDARAPAAKPAPPPAPMILRASEDLRPSVDADQLDPGDPPGWCLARPVPRRRMSVRTAIGRADRLVLRRLAGPAIRRLRAIREYRSGALMAAGVVAAMGRGAPLAALAGLLRLHALRPRDPAPLVSAAAILTDQGLPQEALALLDGASRLKGRTRAGLGIGTRAIALDNRALALIELGRFDEAKPLLADAIRQAPMLSEARTNRSAIDRCRNRDPDVLVGDGGRHRSPGSAPAPEDDPPPVERSLGLRGGNGTGADLPSPPAGPAQAAGFAGAYGDLAASLEDQSAAALASSGAALRSWLASRPSWYAQSVVEALGQSLEDKAADASDGGGRPNAYGYVAAVAAERSAWTASGRPPDCSGYASWFQRFASAYNDAITITAAWERAYTAKADGLLAVLRSPDARAAILESVRATLVADQATAAGQLDYLAGAMSSAGGATPCFTPSPPPRPPALLPPQIAPGALCAATTRGVLAFHSLALVEQCETFWLSTRAASWVGRFPRSPARPRSGFRGSLTLILGPRPGARSAAAGRVAGAGAYLVLGPDNRLTAWGFQVPAAAPVQTWAIADALRRVSSRARPAIGGEQIDIAGAVPTWPATAH